MRRFRCSRGRVRVALVAGSFALGLAASAGEAAAQEKPEAGSHRVATRSAADPHETRSECCLMLVFPVGARQAAMSEAVTSIAAPDAVFYNPAGLAELDGGHFVVHHITSSLLQADAFTLLFSPGNLATFGLSYELIDLGDSDVTGGTDIPIGKVTFREHVLIASFATTFAAGLSGGLNYKYFNRRTGCSGQCGTPSQSSVTHGLDFGVQYRPVWLGTAQFGASLLNVGFPLQVVNSEQADPMPTRLRVGMSYDVMRHIDPAGPYRLWLVVDAQEEDWKQPTSPTPSIAFELSAADIVFLRGGYGAGEGVSSGPSVGVGVIYSNFNVAVAKRVSSGGGFADDPFQLSIDVGF